MEPSTDTLLGQTESSWPLARPISPPLFSYTLAVCRSLAPSLVSQVTTFTLDYDKLMPAGSRLNGTTGARTQMSSIITGILIVLSIFFLLPWLHFLPKVSIIRAAFVSGY